MTDATRGQVETSWQIFLVFLRLGLTSFGGPVAHLGYFREEFVNRRGWLAEKSYADLVALCQFLPGPASSQVGMALGLTRGGYAGVFAAWCGFTLPSALLFIAFALGLSAGGDLLPDGALDGLKVAAVAVVAQAVWAMGRTLCPDTPRVSIMLASTWLMHVVNLSAELGAFIAGVMLANSPYRHDVETNLAPFQGLLMGLFFMSVGASADIRVFFASPLLVLGIVAGVMLIKAAILLFVAKRAQLHGASAWSLALLLACGGEFSFVIFSVGAGAGMIDRELTALLLISVTLSIVVTPLLFKARDLYIARQAARGDFAQFDTIIDKKPRVIVAGIGRFGKLVCRALHSRHVNFTAIDRDTKNVEFAKQFGKQFFYGDVTNSKLLESAGIESAEVLVIAIDDVADSLILAQLSQARWPQLRIIVRARDQEHTHGLMALGVEAIIRETLHAATDAATQALEALGLSTVDAHDAILEFREADQAALLESASAPTPEARRLAYAKLAMQSIQADNVLSAPPSADA